MIFNVDNDMLSRCYFNFLDEYVSSLFLVFLSNTNYIKTIYCSNFLSTGDFDNMISVYRKAATLCIWWKNVEKTFSTFSRLNKIMRNDGLCRATQ